MLTSLTIDNALSISTLTLTSPASFDVAAHCSFHTVDFPPALVQGPTNTVSPAPRFSFVFLQFNLDLSPFVSEYDQLTPLQWAVGPPQTVIDVSCTDSTTPPPPSSITIELDGAADAKYFLTVPLGGGAVATSMFPFSTLIPSPVPPCGLSLPPRFH
jgi:hypothetical protein